MEAEERRSRIFAGVMIDNVGGASLLGPNGHVRVSTR